VQGLILQPIVGRISWRDDKMFTILGSLAKTTIFTLFSPSVDAVKTNCKKVNKSINYSSKNSLSFWPSQNF